jgi:hypothetical protein
VIFGCAPRAKSGPPYQSIDFFGDNGNVLANHRDGITKMELSNLITEKIENIFPKL